MIDPHPPTRPDALFKSGEEDGAPPAFLGAADALIAAFPALSAEQPQPPEDAEYLVHSECGHDPVRLYHHEGMRDVKVGDYGCCWCDDERVRRVTRIEWVPVSEETQK